MYVRKVPVLEHEDLQNLHLIPIPIRQGNKIIASIPSHEIIFTNPEKILYVPIGLYYLEEL